MKIFYHGTSSDNFWRIMKYGFRGNVSITPDFECALSYTDSYRGRYNKKNVISLLIKKGSKQTPTKDKLAGERVYRAEDLIILKRKG